MSNTLARCGCGKHYWVYAFRVGPQDMCPACRAKAEEEANAQDRKVDPRDIPGMLRRRS